MINVNYDKQCYINVDSLTRVRHINLSLQWVKVTFGFGNRHINITLIMDCCHFWLINITLIMYCCHSSEVTAKRNCNLVPTVNGQYADVRRIQNTKILCYFPFTVGTRLRT